MNFSEGLFEDTGTKEVKAGMLQHLREATLEKMRIFGIEWKSLQDIRGLVRMRDHIWEGYTEPVYQLIEKGTIKLT